DKEFQQPAQSSSPRKHMGATLGRVSRAQRSTPQTSLRSLRKLDCVALLRGVVRCRHPISGLPEIGHSISAQVGQARLAWIVTVRGGPGSAVHRSARATRCTASGTHTSALTRRPQSRMKQVHMPPSMDPTVKGAGQAQRTSWRLLALLIAMSGVSSLSLNILVPAIPSLVNQFAADASSVQLTVSLYLLGLATAQVVFGPLSDRFGRRPVLVAGLALATVASTAAIFAATITGLVAARVAQSPGASTGQTIGRAIIRDLYERERAAAMIGLVTSVVVLMPMAAPLIGGVLDTLFGWEAIFVFAAVLSATVFVWAVLALPETRQPAAAPAETSRFLAALAALASSPRFFGYALCAGLGSAPFFSFLGGAPHVVVTMLGRTSAEYGLWFFVPSLGFMAGNFMVSRLTAR